MLTYGKYKADVSGGSVLSIDSVIAEYKLQHDGGQKLLDWIRCHVLWQYDYSERYGGVGKWRYAFTFDFGQESTVTLLCGLYGASGRLEPDKVRIDYNPNKVDCKELWELVSFFRYNAKSSKLVRFDLAFDVPAERKEFMLVRTDQRKRGLEELSDSNFTEYLGRRNCPGRYKLYNKSIEADLVQDLTRSELTCDGKWTGSECVSQFPVVYRFDSYSEKEVPTRCKGSDVGVITMLLRHPEDAYLLDWWDYRKRKSLRSVLAQCSVDSASIHSVLTPQVVDDLLMALRKDILT